MELDPTSLDKAATYRLMISAIVPRPIAWVGSVRADGVDNLAPFSYFMGVSSAPPRLAVSVSRGRGGQLKHTAQGLLETREFTVSIPELAEGEAMNATAADWVESEFDAVGIARVPGTKVRAPRPATARVSLECRVEEVLDLGQVHLFVGQVVLFHVADELLVDGRVDLSAFTPLARLAGDDYALLGERRTFVRPRLP